MPLSEKEKTSLIKKKNKFINLLEDEDSGMPVPAHMKRLHVLFDKIEKEFDALYQENVTLQEKLDLLLSKENERIGTFQGPLDSIESSTGATKKSLSTSLSSGSKLKASYKIRAQTSRIVSSFKTNQSVVSSHLVRDFSGHKDGVWQVSCKKDQKIIGTASADHTAAIFSIDTGKICLQYLGHQGSVNSIKFHNNRDLVLTASGDGSAHIWQGAVNWDMVTRKGHSSEEELDDDEDPIEDRDKIEILRTPLCEFAGPSGHTSVVVCADFISPNYDQIITASWDRQAILWDVETQQSLQNLSGHDHEL